MSDLVLPSATAALAYKRLTEVADRLKRKVVSTRYEPDTGFLLDVRLSAPATIRATERRVLALAEAARDAMRSADAVDLPDGLAIPQGMSKFVVLGAGALEWPYAAQVLGDAKPWVAATMRRGTPDPNRSHVLVDSTTFLVAAANAALDGAPAADVPKIHAYAMGLASAIAAGVVLSPLQRGLWERRTTREWDHRQPADELRHAVTRVHGDLFGGGTAAARFGTWLPAQGDIPQKIYDGYLQALQDHYGFPNARPGFSDFDAALGTPAALDAQQLRSVTSWVRQQQVTYNWGGVRWFFVLLPGVLAIPGTLLAARGLPAGRRYFEVGPPPDERSAYEVLTLGMGLAGIAPTIWTTYLWTQVPEHFGTFLSATIAAGARLAFGVAAVITNFTDPTLEGWKRWGIMWLGMLAADLYALVRAIIDTVGGQPGHAFIHYLHSYPVVMGLISLLFAVVMDALEFEDTGFWVTWVIFTVLSLVGGGVLAWRLASIGGISGLFTRAELSAIDALGASTATRPAALARLFDDSTLWREGTGPLSLDQLRYPSGRRPLVRVWWEGSGTLEIAHDDHEVKLRVDGGDPTVVTLGLGDLTATRIAARLTAALDGVRTEVVDAGTADVRLPHPKTLADPGDRQLQRSEHDAQREDFVGVGDTQDDAYLLAHTPRAELTSPFGVAGPSDADVGARPLVPDASTVDLEESGLGLAAELATLLSMGLAPSLRNAAVSVPAVGAHAALANADPVFQVFRRWNLDERRINEWRMLIHGGATSEKADPARHDPGMRPGAPAGYTSHAAAGEVLANLMGWIPAWRAWLRVAADPTSDTDAATAEPYTPFVTRPDGTVAQPSNAELTAVVRFLLDLP